jgi:hypothetical protein
MYVSAYSSSVYSGKVADRRDDVDYGLVGGIDLPKERGTGHLRGQQPLGLIDGRHDVQGRPIEVPRQRELQSDLGVTQRTAGGHGLQTLDRSELPLQGCGDGRDHRLGTGAGKGRRDLERGKVHVGKLADRQQTVRDGAEQKDAHHDERRRHGPSNEKLRNAHGAGPPGREARKFEIPNSKFETNR